MITLELVNDIILAPFIIWLVIAVFLGPSMASGCIEQMRNDGYYIDNYIDLFLAAVVFIITSPLAIIYPDKMGDVMDFVLFNVSMKE